MKGYSVRFEVCNYNSIPVIVTLPTTATLTINGVQVTASVQHQGGQTFELAALTCQSFDVNIYDQTNSANATITGSFTATWTAKNEPEASDPRYTGSVTFTSAVTATPPCEYPATGPANKCVVGAPTTRPVN